MNTGKDMTFNTDVQKDFFKDENLRQLIHIDELKMRQYHFKLAETPEDFFGALKLVQEVYSQEGYVNAEESSSPCRILRNHFYKQTAIFIGKKGNELVFTVSLFPDTPYGLPMDSIYQEELNCLRDKGRRIGEVGCLATHPDHRDGSQNILMHGNKIMFKYAMENLHLDDLVITVHPKHALIYKKVLLFDDLGMGEVKTYSKVNNNPAVALRLNLWEIREKFKHYYQNNPKETDLHHFVFINRNDTLQLPDDNQPMENNFNQYYFLAKEGNTRSYESVAMARC